MTQLGAVQHMGKHKGSKAKIAKRERALPPELRRAVDADKITRQRALRLVDEGGEAVEEKIADPDRPVANVVALRVTAVVIDRLAKQRHITRSMHEAAVKLRDNYQRSGLDQMRAVDWTRPYVDGGKDKHEPDFQVKALSEFNHAIKKLGPWTYSVISDVVLNDKKPEDASVSGMYRDRQRRGVETLTVLRMGLTALCEHWKLPKDW